MLPLRAHFVHFLLFEHRYGSQMVKWKTNQKRADLNWQYWFMKLLRNCIAFEISVFWTMWLFRYWYFNLHIVFDTFQYSNICVAFWNWPAFYDCHLLILHHSLTGSFSVLSSFSSCSILTFRALIQEEIKCLIHSLSLARCGATTEWHVRKIENPYL